jgi:hypothetical protein
LNKRLLQQVEQENSQQLDEDTTFSFQAAGSVAVLIAFGIIVLTNLPLTLALAQDVVVFALILFAVLVLMFLVVIYGRYRSTRTFWEYLFSLRRIPLSHWLTPFKLDIIGQAQLALPRRQVTLFRRRCGPHQRPKHKAPILLFQKAALLLAP